MSYECYILEHDGKRLRFEAGKADRMPCPLPAKDAAAFEPGAPWETHARLGDDNRLWCEAFRAPGRPGGLFVLRDFDEILMVAAAETHLAFVSGLSRFARMTTYARYAADIFEHADDED